MDIKYFFGAFLSLPLLPLMYLQGKKIRKKVPILPEAKTPEGLYKNDSNKTLNLITIGESTIAGVGVEAHKEGFSGILAKEIAQKNNISVNWKVYAKSGFTAKQVHKKLIKNITKNNIDIIVIGLGGNDAFTLNSPNFWISQIDKLTKKLKGRYPNTPIYFTNMPPIKEFPAFTKTIKFVIGNLVEILGEKLNKYVSKKDSIYFNNEIITLKNWKNKYNIEGDIIKFFSDGVHPSKITYQVWAKDMANFIINSKDFQQWMQKK